MADMIYGDHVGRARTPAEAERNMLTALRALGPRTWVDAPRLITNGWRRWGWHAVAASARQPTQQP